MADLHVSAASLQKIADSLTEARDLVLQAAEMMPKHFPKGFTLAKTPGLNDSLPNLLEFTSRVHARLRVAESEQLFGVSSMTKREERNRRRRRRKCITRRPISDTASGHPSRVPAFQTPPRSASLAGDRSR